MKIINITNEEYHENSALGSSSLKHLLRSPAHYKQSTENNEQTPAMALGSAVHSAILEPELFESSIIQLPPEIKVRRGKVWEAFKEDNSDKTILTRSEYAPIGNIRDAVLNHKLASELLSDGVAENSIFWKNVRGFECKCRPDYYNEKLNMCIDIKTTDNATPYAFQSTCFKYGYHMQASHYLSGLKHEGITDCRFVFIVVEKTPPYGVAVYYASPEIIEAGDEKVNKALDIYEECLSVDEWPSYPEEMKEISLPEYMKK